MVPLVPLLLLQVQKQSLLSHTAQDSQSLWEEELKSRSKLGLRLAELEKERGELNTQVRRLLLSPFNSSLIVLLPFCSSFHSCSLHVLPLIPSLNDSRPTRRLLFLPSSSSSPDSCGDGFQVEMEKKRVKKVTEQKRSVDSRLEQEMQRNTELQKEMYR